MRRLAVPVLAVLALAACAAHPILLYEPRIGMPASEAIGVYGRPDSIDRHAFENHVVEHWVYRYVNGGTELPDAPMLSCHLRFVDGRLESWHAFPR